MKSWAHEIVVEAEKVLKKDEKREKLLASKKEKLLAVLNRCS